MDNISNQQSPLILIADDDQTTRKILQLLLQKDQYQVVEVTNGQECLDAFYSLKPDVILLDAIMPILDGFECCEQLQKLPQGRETPVLMITGLDDQKSVNRAFAVGAIDYITKPIHPPLLRQRLKRILQASRAKKALKESEKKYKYLVNNLKEIIFQTDMNGRFIFLNSAWEHITGFTVAESLGQDFKKIIHPNDYKIYEKNLELLTKNKTSNISDISEEKLDNKPYQIKITKKNQSFCCVEIYAYLVTHNGELIISGTINDITQIKSREKYLKIENEVRQILAESNNIKETNSKILEKISHNLNWQWGEVWFTELPSNQLKCMTIWEEPFLRQQIENSLVDNFYATTKGLAAQTFKDCTPIWIDNISENNNLIRLEQIQKIGFKTLLNFPLTVGEQQLGLINFFSLENKEPETEIIKLMNSLGSQIGQFIRRKMAEEELQQQNQLLQSELNKAANYVRSLLPSPLIGKVSINQQFLPSLQLGGDAFDYYWLDQDNLLIYLLDVAGHGVQSALLSVSVLNLLRSQSLYNTDFYQPWTVLEELNRIFQMDNHGQSYLTIWYGVYNLKHQELIYGCAGHPPALLIKKDGTFKKFGGMSIPVGMLPDIEFEDKLSKISPDSTLYIFSDGIYEIFLENREIWGLDAFIDLIITEHQSHEEISLNSLITKIQTITKTKVFGDDLSILQIKF
jgi:sigma-B regulation protein RsbU (phosphoserine phosphatase)